MSFDKKAYEGAKSTLCTGCGHDSITQHIINACFQSQVDPYNIAKLSGIGCSSKTPAYFLNASHGFNTIHGRMSAVATGVHLANRQLQLIGVSGDGDTASIGLGSFAHLLRRNVPMLYIIENNGVYGLTKGQFSATADLGSTQKNGEVNHFSAIDICSMAIDLGATFVARSFSGDSKQLVPLISAGLRHPGTAVIDVISPCITFANHEGSTKSYDAVRAHNIQLQELGFIQSQKPIEVDFPAGETTTITLHDGSRLLVRKLAGHEYDLSDPLAALQTIYSGRKKGELLTGLLHYREQSSPLWTNLNLCDASLAHLMAKDLKPSESQLSEALAEFA